MKITIEIEIDENEVLNHGTPSNYARVFDKENPYWQNSDEANIFYLKQQEQYANAVLRAKGYLFLNDVYDMLGFPRTKLGQIVGWNYDSENGNSFVSFGDYQNGFILDFNVDGEILSKVEIGS